MHINKFWFFASLITCSAITFSLTSTNNTIPTPQQPQKELSENPLQIENKKLTRELSDLQIKNRELQLQLEQNTIKTHVNTKDSAPTKLSSTEDCSSNTQQAIAQEKKRNKQDEFDRLVKSSPTAITDIEKRVMEKIKGETVDPIWAPQQEQKIRSAFTDNINLRGIALKDSKCHSTQCELSISVSNSEHANDDWKNITASLESISKDSSVIYFSDPKTNTATFYIAAKGTSLDFN